MNDFRKKEICNLTHQELIDFVSKNTYLLSVSICKNGKVRKKVSRGLNRRTFDDGTDEFNTCASAPIIYEGDLLFTVHKNDVTETVKYWKDLKNKFLCTTLEEINQIVSAIKLEQS